MSKKVIAWDLGTGGNKASLYDEAGNCLAATFKPYPTNYPKHGWHEQKPEDWWEAIVETTSQLIRESKVNPDDIAVCGISGHSLGAVPIDKNGNLLLESTPIWSDGRATEQAKEFFSRYDEEKWYNITGNGFTPALYTVFKMMWYRDNCPEIFEKTEKVIGTKDYINYKLTGRVVTDYSYASGYGVFDLKNMRYDEDLIDASKLSKSLFPEIVPSTEVIGTISKQAASHIGLREGTKVVAGGVDNSCMALGAMAYKENRAYMNLGSCFWIAISSENPILSSDSRPYVFAHVLPGMYASALCISSGGTSYRWVRDELCKDLKLLEEQTGRDAYELMGEEAATVKPGANKVIFNPSLGGGMPYDKSVNIRGAYMGLDLGTSRASIIRASMEGMGFAMRLCLDYLNKLGANPEGLLLAGGGSKSPLLCQIFADCFKLPTYKSIVDEQAAALGAAAVAAVGAGIWKDFDIIDTLHKREGHFMPEKESTEVYEKLYSVFLEGCDDQSDIGDMLNSLTI